MNVCTWRYNKKEKKIRVQSFLLTKTNNIYLSIKKILVHIKHK